MNFFSLLVLGLLKHAVLHPCSVCSLVHPFAGSVLTGWQAISSSSLHPPEAGVQDTGRIAGMELCGSEILVVTPQLCPCTMFKVSKLTTAPIE